MKRGHCTLLAFLPLSALALASCKLDLFSFSPTITFSVQNPYTSSPISIGYTIPSDNNIFNSGGSAVTNVILEKKIAGTYMLFQQYVSNNGSSGNLYFDLSQILASSGQGFSSYTPVDGTYLVSMQVLSGGKPLPGYYGQRTFTVDTSAGKPTITEVTPGVWSASSLIGTIPVVISGYHFPANATLTATVTPSTAGTISINSAVVKGSTEIDAQVSATITTSSIPPEIIFTVTDPSTGNISTFQVVVSSAGIGFATPTSTVPSAATGAGNVSQIILLYGTNFTPFTDVTMTDGHGNPIPVFANTLQGQVVTYGTGTPPIIYPITSSGMIPIYANLSGAATGSATITVTNPDGSSATTSFAIN